MLLSVNSSVYMLMMWIWFNICIVLHHEHLVCFGVVLRDREMMLCMNHFANLQKLFCIVQVVQFSNALNVKFCWLLAVYCGEIISDEFKTILNKNNYRWRWIALRIIAKMISRLNWLLICFWAYIVMHYCWLYVQINVTEMVQVTTLRRSQASL